MRVTCENGSPLGRPWDGDDGPGAEEEGADVEPGAWLNDPAWSVSS
ncbi:hypothetical protein ACFY2T_15120 [Streptomyces sp. NPDC001260]